MFRVTVVLRAECVLSPVVDAAPPPPPLDLHHKFPCLLFDRSVFISFRHFSILLYEGFCGNRTPGGRREAPNKEGKGKLNT